MLSKKIIPAILLTLSIVCTAASHVSSGQQQQGEMLREEFHQTYALAPGGRVGLENINGAVRVTAWDRDEVRVDAVKSAYKRERLDEAKIEVRSERNGVYISTTYPERSLNFTNGEGRYNNPATVEYTLTVPRTARINSIELVNGDLDIEGVTGEVRASSVNGRVTAKSLVGLTRLTTVNGKLEASFSSLADAGSVSLGSVNGPVTLTIPSDSNAELKANTVHGRIHNDFGLPVHAGEYVGRDLAGQLGQGGPRVKLGNVNGAITIRRAADGRPLSPATNLLSVTGDDKDDDNDADEDDDGDAARTKAEARAEARRAAREAARERLEARRAELETEREAAREIAREQAERRREAARVRVDTERVGREAARAARDAIRSAGVELEGYNNLRLVERESKSFNVTGTPTVNLQTFDGNITVRGWDRQEVQLTVSKRAATEKQLRGIRLRADQTNSNITVTAEFDKSAATQVGGGVYINNALVNLEVNVPRNSSVKLVSGDGRLELSGVNGSLELTTGDGRIDVRDARGRLTATTGDGRIMVEDFDGALDARTGDGRIELDGRFDHLAARTESGTIVLGLPGDYSATIETESETVDNEGLNLTEETAPSRRQKRWKVNKGGKLLSLRTEEGRIILRNAGR